MHSKIKKGNLRGYVLENEKFYYEGHFDFQCIIAGPSRVLILTITVPDTKEDKEWAFQVIDTIKFYK